MKKYVLIICVLVVLASIIIVIASEEKPVPPEKNFFEKSLHFTSNGLKFWYSKEQGGVERITGVPVDQINCMRCHVKSCDTCHLKVVNGKSAYSVDVARSQAACRNCHGMGEPEKDKNGKEIPLTDVHFKKGMKCMDCHSIREIHGDGTMYNSFQQQGAMDANCEKCHSSLSKTPSHLVHSGRVDCQACHVLERPSCYNCHFDTRIKKNESHNALELKNLLFLVNKNGKVTLAAMHTFVYENKTMITFAPSFPHDVQKAGRKCEECHNTKIIKDIKKNKFNPITYEKGELKNIQGVVPVIEGIKWNLPWFNYENGKWIPISNPPEPLINYAGYCTPITKEQLNKLDMVVSKK